MRTQTSRQTPGGRRGCRRRGDGAAGVAAVAAPADRTRATGAERGARRSAVGEAVGIVVDASVLRLLGAARDGGRVGVGRLLGMGSRGRTRTRLLALGAGKLGGVRRGGGERRRARMSRRHDGEGGGGLRRVRGGLSIDRASRRRRTRVTFSRRFITSRSFRDRYQASAPPRGTAAAGRELLGRLPLPRDSPLRQWCGVPSQSCGAV